MQILTGDILSIDRSILDAALRAWNIAELKNELARQAQNRFGPYEKVLKTVCAVKVSSVGTTQDDGKVQFQVLLGVIKACCHC